MSNTNTLHETRAAYMAACNFLGITYRQKDLAELLELSPFKLSRLLQMNKPDTELFKRLNWFDGERLFFVELSLQTKDYEALGLL
jgi:hypothetical protein